MKKDIFPLYYDDGICIEPGSQLRNNNIEKFKKAIDNKELKFVDNRCLCHNEHPENDIVISEKDRYGFAIPQILCSKCGLIRSGMVLDETSNRLFYEKYYRGIYLASTSTQDKNEQIHALFTDQYGRGKRILSLVKNQITLDETALVAEVGCGAGGVLLPFKEIGLNVIGYDFDNGYLNCGRDKGLNLCYGDFYELSQNASCDFILINHVLEHFLDPIGELCRLLPKLKVGGYLYIEVPGILNIHKAYISPILYFQNAHVYNYYKDFLRVMFEKLGLKVVYGDEVCRFIVQKINDRIPDNKAIYDETLSHYPQLIMEYLANTKRWERWNYRILKRQLKNIIPDYLVTTVRRLVNYIN